MARGALGRKPAETDEDAETGAVVVDKDQEVDQFRSGQVSEDELTLARSVAKRMGWTPKEDWKRDPDKWVDADKFLEQTPRELEALKERNRRTAQAAEAAIEEQRRSARAEALAEARAAAQAQDPDRAEKAAERLASVSGPPPQTVAWMGRNPWFQADPDAQGMAVNEINRLAATGASIEDQLEAAEAKVRRRFPEHFGQAEPREERKEARLSDRPPPQVQPGTRATVVHSKEKAFGDIPAGDRALFQKHFARRYESTGLTSDQAQAKYAKAYWTNKE